MCACACSRTRTLASVSHNLRQKLSRRESICSVPPHSLHVLAPSDTKTSAIAAIPARSVRQERHTTTQHIFSEASILESVPDELRDDRNRLYRSAKSSDTVPPRQRRCPGCSKALGHKGPLGKVRAPQGQRNMCTTNGAWGRSGKAREAYEWSMPHAGLWPSPLPLLFSESLP